MSTTSLTEKIRELASEDDAFRAALLADPRAAIEKVVGRPLPDGVDVRVIEETAASPVIVLPAKSSSDRELTDVELEQVAGGGCGWCMFTDGTWCWFTH